MGYRYVVLGAGRQGVAAAYDLGRFGKTEGIVLADLQAEAAEAGATRVNGLLGKELATPACVDVNDIPAVEKLLTEANGFLSAVPYKFNLGLTEAAIRTRTHMVDLGGHTGIVRRQIALDPEARKAGVAVVPDCGMGPGMNVTLALHAMSLLDEPHEVRIYDGGLPQAPRPPWNYALLFSVEGLINEYDGDAYFIRDGRVTPVLALTELEELEIPPLGRLEAFVTSGGLSTMPWSFQGRLRTLENKTLRYPGHCALLRGLKEAGLFSAQPVEVGGCGVVPRALLALLLEERLGEPGVRDVCVIHVRARGKKDGRPAEARVQLVDYYDEATGFSAMEKLTGWHAALVLELAVRGEIPPGVVPIERALSGERFLPEAARRGWTVQHAVFLEAA